MEADVELGGQERNLGKERTGKVHDEVLECLATAPGYNSLRKRYVYQRTSVEHPQPDRKCEAHVCNNLSFSVGGQDESGMTRSERTLTHFRDPQRST